MLRYTRDHEWIRLDGDIATVGITSYAQEKLGDLVFVELPAVGKHFEQGAAAATVESVKAASDIYAPVSGDIVETNRRLGEEPALVNSAPTGDGWLFRMKVADRRQLESLLDEPAYQAILT
jgi:glycine cleavage system H protein